MEVMGEGRIHNSLVVGRRNYDDDKVGRILLKRAAKIGIASLWRKTEVLLSVSMHLWVGVYYSSRDCLSEFNQAWQDIAAPVQSMTARADKDVAKGLIVGHSSMVFLIRKVQR
jgi:hypothetical protein